MRGLFWFDDKHQQASLASEEASVMSGVSEIETYPELIIFVFLDAQMQASPYFCFYAQVDMDVDKVADMEVDMVADIDINLNIEIQFGTRELVMVPGVD